MPAPTITRAGLAQAMRLVADGDVTGAEADQLDTIMGAGVSILAEYSPGAPEPCSNMALIRFAGAAWDSPFFARSPVDLFRKSGAMALVAMWRVPEGVST